MTSSAHPVDDALGFLGARLRHDEPLGPLCTYRVGGRAARFVLVEGAEDLARIAAALADIDIGDGADQTSVLVVGRGSNMLVAEAGHRGLVLQLGEAFAQIEQLPTSDDPASRTLRVGGAASLPVVARRSVALGLSDFEWAVGVPGSIGGAVRMNAGGHGADMSEVLSGVRVVDLSSGEDVLVPTAALDLGYRRSSIRAAQVVVHADLVLRVDADPEGSVDAGEQRLSEIVRWRRANQPGGQNAGSVFTNPPGDSAGRLIDAAGGKGLRVGSAAVSTKHANFIQADAGGSADDVVALMIQVVDRVHAHSGVRLHAETVLVGFDRDLVDALSGPAEPG